MKSMILEAGVLRIIILFACSCHGLIAAAAQSNINCPNKNSSEQTHDRCTTSIQGTKDSPLYVQTTVVPRDEKELADERIHQEEDRKVSLTTLSYVEKTACYTAALAIVATLQMLLFWYQLMMMRQSVKDGTTAAKAAENSSKAIIESERARIFVTVSIPTPVCSAGAGAHNDFLVEFHNHGKTVARIKMIRAYATIAETIPSDLIAVDKAEQRLPDGIAISSDSPPHQEIAKLILTDEDMRNVLDSRTSIFVVGKIVYEDIFDRERVTGFCWRVWPRKSIFVAEFDRKSVLNYQT